MKRKLLLMATATLLAFAVYATTASQWVKVNDSCNKCVMNDSTRKCGKCGGFMESVSGTSTYDNGYVKSNYKCKKCGHTITYKNK